MELSGCSDITWADSNGHCRTFDGCKDAGSNPDWKHYFCKLINYYLIKNYVFDSYELSLYNLIFHFFYFRTIVIV